MNEFIEIRFFRNTTRIRVDRQVTGGFVFDEPDAVDRTVGLGLRPRNAATAARLDHVRRTQGWLPGEFRLAASVEDGSLVLRGTTPHALPSGFFKLRLQIEEVQSTGGWASFQVEHNRHATVDVRLKLDTRRVEADLTDADTRILELLGRSTIDGMTGEAWVASSQKRPTRQACLLNLLASMRARPKVSRPLIDLVDHVFWVANDRIYAKVDKRLLDVLLDLADDDDQPFYEEGTPHSKIHEQLFVRMDEPADVKARFEGLCSFRAEARPGQPSMQVVVAVAPADLSYTYAEFDLDLGNPLQDLAGFFVHMGELLDGKATNHLDLWRPLRAGSAAPYLHYRVVAGV
jgi:hypothetical protein